MLPLGGNGYLETCMMMEAVYKLGQFATYWPPTGAEKICQLVILFVKQFSSIIPQLYCVAWTTQNSRP